MDRGNYLERLTAVCLVQRSYGALERALHRDFTVSELVALLDDRRAGVRGAAALALGAIGDYAVAPPLAQRLHDQDVMVRLVAEQSLWAIWLRSGDQAIDNLMREAAALLQRGMRREAIQVLTTVIEQRPDFPEGYNQRAIAHYLNQDPALALADCEKAIALNPIHFGAWAGMGHCYLHLRNREKALEAYERALEINPNMEQIRLIVQQLRGTINQS
ncbi:MAG: tetratricopeptide repeat protein [Abditibacteriales bacterium]|nr:tetratricopeptide repeat protein [Abditibacteriales bacterium]MDW8364533.1 tetratricopeptide repeat protein [Abditibacteriales bacterium]